VPEGDTVHRAANALQALVGDVLEATSPNPRGRVTRVAEHVNGKRLSEVTAYGKNVVLRFDGAVDVRSHLGMTGRWVVQPPGGELRGAPWLVLSGKHAEAVLWNGPTLELHLRALAGLGPDILEHPPRLDVIVRRFGAADGGRFLGESLLDQRLVAGIGNKWLAEMLWAAELSPWLRLHEVGDGDLRRALVFAAERMTASVAGRRAPNQVYRLVGRPCPRCAAAIRSHGQGDANRMTYWCAGCQVGGEAPARN